MTYVFAFYFLFTGWMAFPDHETCVAARAGVISTLSGEFGGEGLAYPLDCESMTVEDFLFRDEQYRIWRDGVGRKLTEPNDEPAPAMP